VILHWFYDMPDLAILAVVVVVVTAIAMLAPQISRRVLRLGEHKEREDAAFDGYKAVTSMIGVVLAFSLVQANGVLRSLDGAVEREASAISTADRLMLRIGQPELADLRPALAAYARSLVNDEWPLLAEGQRSLATDDAYVALSKPARSVTPSDSRQQAMYNELLRNLDDIADLREEILAATDEGLPRFFWITVVGLLAVGAAVAAVAGSGLSRAVGLAAPATAIALLLAFVIIVDQPFDGDTSVKPTPIEKMLIVIARRS
jgi:hypothetical protein